MSLQQWYLKTFEKSKIVHAYIHGGGRIKSYYAIPKVIGNQKTGTTTQEIECGDGTYFINERDFKLDRDGIPTFTYTVGNRIPVDMDALKTYTDTQTPQSYQVGIHAHVATDILKQTNNKMDSATISLILSFITLLAVGATVYFVMQQQEMLKNIDELLKLIGGIE